jgi:hypothetical protein
MNTFVLRLCLVVCLLWSTKNISAHVALDYPLGGETFVVGQTITIEWHIVAHHNTLNWDLFFSPDGGLTWETIQLDIPTSQLSYEWEVPNAPTSQGRVRVFQDNEETNYLDNSMDFVIVLNTSPPLLDAPATDTTIECGSAQQGIAIQAWLNNHGGAAATNYCGNLIWTNDFPGISNGCGGTGSAEVTFLATDDCGQVLTNATVTIVDTSPPVVDVSASDWVVESDGQGNTAQLNLWLNSHGGAQASDVCGDVAWAHNFVSLNDGCGSAGSVMVTFTATDECGNTAITVATFTIQDQLAPGVLVAARDTAFSCGEANQNQLQQWLNQHGGAEAYDVGGDVTWTHNFAGLGDGCGMTGSADVVFTVTDECGNSTMVTATVSIDDRTAPVISTPAMNVTFGCEVADQQTSIQQWLAGHGGAQASDACDVVTWANNYTSLSHGCGATGMANVIFTVTDGCGNSSTTSAFIQVEDTVAPLIEVQAQDITFVCGIDDASTAIQDWLDQQGGASASDLCGNVTWINDFTALADTCGPAGMHAITFIATDECGHTNMTQAILTIKDSLVTALPVVDDLDFKVYPNPASDVLIIAFDRVNLDQVELTLFNLCGKELLVDVSTAKESTIPIGNYSAGTYFLQVRTRSDTYIRKVIFY